MAHHGATVVLSRTVCLPLQHSVAGRRQEARLSVVQRHRDCCAFSEKLWVCQVHACAAAVVWAAIVALRCHAALRASVVGLKGLNGRRFLKVVQVEVLRADDVLRRACVDAASLYAHTPGIHLP